MGGAYPADLWHSRKCKSDCEEGQQRYAGIGRNAESNSGYAKPDLVEAKGVLIVAVTKIFAIRNQLQKSVQYAANEMKTTLDGAIEYAVNPDKTEKRLFESVLNCNSVESACEDMQATKRRFSKTDGVLGYHFIQAFKPGELTPEQAHQIGIEFAGRLLGDRFESVIGTHLDKEHLHNHIIANSVSFKDGKKFRCNMQTYFKEVQRISDELCREHGLSVIKPKGRGKQYQEWKAEKEGKPTIRTQIRQDIDGLITQSLNFTTFLNLLQKNGYSVKHGNVKHTAVKPKYSQRFIRLDSLGENYTDVEIEARILSQKSWSRNRLPEPKKHYRYIGDFKKVRKATGFRALYFYYVYLLRGAVRGIGRRKVSRFLLEDTVKFERYLAQHRFLTENKIDTISDLQEIKASIQKQIDEMVAFRKPLYDDRRLSEYEQKPDALSNQISFYTSQIKNLRRDLRLCVQIETDAERISTRVYEAQQISREEELNYESRKRSGRTADQRSNPDFRGSD